jgi:septum formation protein
VQAVDLDERPQPGEAPADLAVRLAIAKAVEGARRSPGSVVLGADTVVAVGTQSLGKPASPHEAMRMLKKLRGHSHSVITAVATALAPQGSEPRAWSRVSTTNVEMREYTDADIDAYVATGDALDKAGAYAIQHAGFHPVRQLTGCYLTVVGLPLPETLEVLAEAGLEVPRFSERELRSICPACTDLERLPLNA